MRTDVLQTIKDTLEQSQNITVLNIYEEDNIVFGIYINDVRDSLSFLEIPPVHLETNVMGIQIEFFELGAVLHHIYYTGALKFADILRTSDANILPDNDFMTLINFVLENLPFDVAQLKFIEAFNSKRTEEYNDEQKETLTFLRDIMLTFLHFVKQYSDYNLYIDFEPFTDDIKTESDYVKVFNQLNMFKQELQGVNFKKISKKDMSTIDNMYTNIQIIHMKV